MDDLCAAEQLGVYPMSSVLIVDDTSVGIAAGRNAQTWTVAVAKTGNALGLSEDELAHVPAERLNDSSGRFVPTSHKQEHTTSLTRSRISRSPSIASSNDSSAASSRTLRCAIFPENDHSLTGTLAVSRGQEPFRV